MTCESPDSASFSTQVCQHRVTDAFDSRRRTVTDSDALCIDSRAKPSNRLLRRYLREMKCMLHFMKVAVPVLAPVLRSEVQGRILAEVFASPETEHTVTHLAAKAATSVPTAIREVDRAEAAELVSTRRLGNTRLVRANPDNPLYEPFRQIILATYGPPAVIGQEMNSIDGIEELYLFGSWAARYSGEAGRAPNDLDVLVIGSPDRDEIHDAAERAERRMGLPVQATIRSEAQWQSMDDPFLVEVRSRPLVSLKAGSTS